MPTLASSYHRGRGLWSRLAQLGWYRVRGPGTWASTSAPDRHAISATRSVQAEIAISSISRRSEFRFLWSVCLASWSKLNWELYGENGFLWKSGFQRNKFTFGEARSAHFHKGINQKLHLKRGRSFSYKICLFLINITFIYFTTFY